MKKSIIFAIFLCLNTFNLFSKDFTLTGTIFDKTTDKPLESATVSVHSLKDSSIIKGEYTNRDGKFKIENIPMGGYFVKITYVGYKTIFENVRPMGKDLVDIGKLNLEPDAVMMKSVVVTDDMVRAEIKGDTTEFNSKAFKTQPNAQTDELVKKIPGVQIESSGNIKAHGEDVKEVLVNGKQYFGDDPTMAMKNIPADVIDKVQIFDKMGEQAQFTGIDDGSRYKAMNLITKGNLFTYGKVYAGYGSDDRYTSGGSLNFFKGDMRLSILGMSNNINQQNFNFQDIIGIFGQGGRMGGPRPNFSPGMAQQIFSQRPQGFGGFSPFGNFFVGNLSGITQTHAAGVNFVNQFGTDLSVTASYFVNYTNNDNNQNLNRQYYVQGDSSFYYNQYSDNTAKNLNQRFSGRIEWKIDSLNSVIIRPNGSLQNTKYNYDQLGTNLSTLTLTNTIKDTSNTANSLTNSDYNAYNISNETLIRHRFGTPGRTISLDINNSFVNNKGNSYLDSYYSNYLAQSMLYDTLNQLNNTVRSGYTHNGNLMYTEPVTDSSQLSLSYFIERSYNNEDRALYNYNQTTQLYSILDSSLSNFADTKTTNQKVGLGYHFDYKNIDINANLNYQLTNFENNKTEVNPYLIQRKYENLLPSLRLRYSFSKTSDLRAFFNTSLTIPSVSQLSPVIDNSNPLQITTGNPDLTQQISYTLFTRYFTILNDNRSSFFIMAYYALTDNYISNQTFMTKQDTVVNGYNIVKGAQLIIPANFDKSITARTFTTYSLPIDFIKSTLNLNLGVTFSETPGKVNGIQNITDNYAYTTGIDLNSNISPEIDYSIGFNGTLNKIQNQVQRALNGNYYNITSYARLNWTIWKGFFISLDFNYLYSSGYSDGFNQDLFITNLGIGNRALYKNNFDLKFQVFDVFDKTKSISRNVTDSYFEDVQSLTLRRYGIFTLTYYLRPF